MLNFFPRNFLRTYIQPLRMSSSDNSSTFIASSPQVRVIKALFMLSTNEKHMILSTQLWPF